MFCSCSLKTRIYNTLFTKFIAAASNLPGRDTQGSLSALEMQRPGIALFYGNTLLFAVAIKR